MSKDVQMCLVLGVVGFIRACGLRPRYVLCLAIQAAGWCALGQDRVVLLDGTAVEGTLAGIDSNGRTDEKMIAACR